MKRCFIFAAGTFYGLRTRPREDDLVLAADAGFENCKQAGIVPCQLLGDFDSMDQPEDFDNVVRAPVEKDDTDTLLAVRTGLSQGCTEFHIYGGTGGKRMDHTIANLQTLLFIREHGGHGYLYDNDFVWTVISDETIAIVKKVEWGLLSLFCLGDRATGVTIRGAQYPLTDGELAPGFPVGVSNHILEESAEISVAHGTLLVGWELPPLKK